MSRLKSCNAGLAAASPSGGTRFRVSTLVVVALIGCLTNGHVHGQNATELPQQKEKKKQEKIVAKEQEKTAQRANLEIRGNRAFDDKTLRSQLKEQIATIEQYGLTTARGDDAAFFLELYYKKHGYAKVQVSYTLVGGNGLRLDIAEGPLVHLSQINFVGVAQLPKQKVFEYAVRLTL